MKPIFDFLMENINTDFTLQEAYWITPRGKVIPVTGFHINKIFDSPEMFGLNKEKLEEIYKKHNEPFGIEGNARQEIMKDLIFVDGFIRIRNYKKKNFWSIQCKTLNNRTLDILFDWANEMVDRLKVPKFGTIKISTANGDLTETDFNDIITFKLYKNVNESMELTESSLSRLKEKANKHSIGIISAFRNEYSRKENIARNKLLKAKLQDMGYDVTTIKGFFIENFKTNNEIRKKETSLFVTNPTVGDDNGKLEKDLQYLATNFGKDEENFVDQDSIVSKRFGKDAVLIGTSKQRDAYPGFGKKENLGNIFAGKEGEFYSTIKNRPFVIESIVKEEYSPTGFMGRLGLSTSRNARWHDLIE